MSTIASVLDGLYRQGLQVALHESGERLEVGPTDLLTDAIRAEIQLHRQGILDVLRATVSVSSMDIYASDAPTGLVTDSPTHESTLGQRNERNELNPSLPEARRLLKRLRFERGVTVGLHADGQRIKATPATALTAGDVVAIRALKPALTDYLLTFGIFGRSEVAWRLDHLRRRVPTEGTIPFLRTQVVPNATAGLALNLCQSCGDPLADDAESARTEAGRCAFCAEAARTACKPRLVGLESWCWCGELVYRYADDGTPYCKEHQAHIEVERCA